METMTFNSEKDFKKMFNPKIQPRHIKSVNGVPVNVGFGPKNNELKVTNKHVYAVNYSVNDQNSTLSFFKAPFIIEY